jgi:hypothetical protein
MGIREALKRFEMANDGMTKHERNPKDRGNVFRHSSFVIISSFNAGPARTIRHSSLFS